MRSFLSDVFTIPPGTEIRGETLLTTSKSITLISVTDAVSAQNTSIPALDLMTVETQGCEIK